MPVPFGMDFFGFILFGDALSIPNLWLYSIVKFREFSPLFFEYIFSLIFLFPFLVRLTG